MPTDKPSKPTNSGENTPSSTEKPVTTTSKPPVDKLPANKLPGTGGKPSKHKNNTGKQTQITKTTKHSKNATTSRQSSSLPKSGNITNRLLPLLGAILGTSMLGLYVFLKKRKS